MNDKNKQVNNDDIGLFMFGVGGLIQYQDTDEILVLKRATNYSDFNQDKWELLFGRKAQLEEIDDALRREAKEEINLEDFEILKVLRVWHFFRGERKPDKEIIGMTFWCRTQHRKIKLSAEHSEYRWVSPDEALQLISVKGIQDDIRTFIKYKNELKCTISKIDGNWVHY